MRWIGTFRGPLCLGALVWVCGAPCASLAEDAVEDSVQAPVINPLRLGSKARGKPAGRWVEWRGGAKWVGEYEDGKRHGVWEGTVPVTDDSHFAEPVYAGFASPLSISVTLNQNVPHGEVSAVDAQQRPVFTWHFDQGVLEGKALWWHASGQLRRQATYRAGLLDGPVTQWNADGEVTRQETYREGRASGAHIAWHDQGHKHYEGYSNLAGDVTRDSFDWLDLEWRQDKVDEHLHEQRCGRWTAWYLNGQKKCQGSYQDGEAEGRFTWWHENGQKMAEGEFISGKRHGAWRWWHSNGRKQMQGDYQYGQPSGHWEAWTADGASAKADRSKATLTLDWDKSAPDLQSAQRALSRPIRTGVPVGTAEAEAKPQPVNSPTKSIAKVPTSKAAAPTPLPSKAKSAGVAPGTKRPDPKVAVSPAPRATPISPNTPYPAAAGNGEQFTLLGLLTGEPQSAGTMAAPRNSSPIQAPPSSSGTQSTSRNPKLSHRPSSAAPLRPQPQPATVPQQETPRNLIADLLGLEEGPPPQSGTPRAVRR